MKRPVAMTLALVICSFVLTFSAGAVDAPHYDTAAGNSCATCHTSHLDLGSTGYNNICLNCHRPGDPAAGSKPITLADAANPFGTHSAAVSKQYQTSHRWDGSDTNPAAGALPPVQGQMTTGGLRARTGGQLACVRCHNQHEKGLDGKFLRVQNDQDQLCLDCHRTRNVQSHTKGSHPVGIAYDGTKTGFKNLTAANPTANLKNYLKNGNVSCSTCHGVHFTDSRSSTVDGSAQFANLSSGDGHILRTDRRGKNDGAGYDSANLCTNCHAGKKSHNMKGQDVQCADCHGTHVEYDPQDPTGANGTNIYLIRRNVTNNGQPSQIFFRYTGSRTEYVNGSGKGVCQGCHAVPAFPSNPGAPEEHSSSDPKVCTTCHFHNSTNGSFSGACTTCHGYPPITAAGLVGYTRPTDTKTGATPGSPGGHATHAMGRFMACNTCHTGFAAPKAMPSNTIDIGFTINGSTFKGFAGSVSGGTFNGTTLNSGYSWSAASGTALTNGNGAITCSVYCHGTTLTGGSITTPTWTTTDGSQKACGACHGVTAATAPVTGSHMRHAGNGTGALAILCASCHGTYTDNDHVNGSVDWNLNGLTGGGLYKGSATGATGAIAPSASFGSCSNVSCHADPYSSGTVTTPVWGNTSAGCTACHNGGGAFTGTGTAPATGSHNKHMAASAACADCHTGAVAGSSGGTAHIDGNISVTSGYPATVAKHTAGTYTGTCSAASCHANPYGAGTVTTPVWGTSAGCASCHTGTPGAFTGTGTAPATGSHNKHMALTGAACSQCHAGAVAGSSGGTAHIDGNIDVTGGYPANVAKHTAGTYAGTCSTASCHANPYGAGTVTTPIWGASAGCAACHTGTGAFTGTGSAPATGGHNVHMALTGVTCGQCHSGASTTSGGSAHIDGTISVTNGYPATVAKHAAGSGYSSCATSTCHGAPTPTWGVSTTNNSCTKCHGTATVTVTADNRYVLAPSGGTITGTGQVSSSPKIGAHQTHLRYLNGFSNYSTIDYRCQNCHGPLPVSGTHANGSSTPVFQGLATKFGTYTAAKYVSGTGSCAVYCHNPAKAGGTLSAGNVGTGTAPIWTDANYIADGAAKTAANCDKCHLSPNNSRELSTVYSHSAVALTENCAGCHGHNGDTTGVAGRRHMDGIKYGNGSCNNCHGYPPLTATQLSARAVGEFTDAAMESYSGGGGYHTTHLLSSITVSNGFTPCMPCHPSTKHNQGAGVVAKANVNVNDEPTVTSYRFDDNRSKRYNSAAMTCSNISCHFKPTPAW